MTNAANDSPFWTRMRRARREIGPLRMVASLTLLILALFIARYSWAMPFTDEIERVLFDVRASYAMEQVEEDDRIVIIVYDENTLFDTGVRSPLDRDILARALTNIDALAPRAIGVDILIDQPTPNDEILAEALRGMTTPTYLAFVSMENNPLEIQPRQEDFRKAFFDSVDTEAIDTASVFLLTD
ncbi:MAG: CHASE2 domain-containing protein, partial [Parasphingopyxis sp.]